MDAKYLLNKMAAKESNFRSKEFVAPFTEKSKKVHVKIDNIVYPIRIIGHSGNGFGIFKSIDGSCAKFIKMAPFELHRAYLDMLPQQLLILCYQNEQGWIAYPMNAESARKSIGLESEVPVRGVSDCERFDIIISRFDGLNFWFDSMWLGGNIQKSIYMRECFDPKYTPQRMKELLSSIREISPEDKKSFDLAIASWIVFTKQSTEDKIRNFIEMGGAKLRSYVIRGENIEVKWTSKNGNIYDSLVDKNFDVVSAGICLSNEDHKFHLKDLPFIIDIGEDREVIHITRRV